MAARFQVDVQRGAAHLRRGRARGRFQREHFGVLHAIVSVRSLANDFAIGAYQHRAHAWIRRGERNALRGERKRAAHVALVGGIIHKI